MEIDSDEELVRIPTASDVAALEYPPFEWPGKGFIKALMEIYKYTISCLVQQLRMWELRWQANVVGALFWEPLKSIQAGISLSEGREREFHHYGMNPLTLTEEQRARPPILALHGKNGTQGTFISMAKAFQKAEVGPLFTLNLHSGELSMEDSLLIDAKIQEIKALYNREVKVDIIGYSRGAEMALYMGLQQGSWHIKKGGYCIQDRAWDVMRPDIGRIFRIGSMTLPEEWEKLPEEYRDKLFEARGSEDILMPEKSLAYHQFELYEGHVGLPDSAHLHQWLIHNLSS
ncbi:MAG: hypothetical protein K1060chlam2_01111 [Chlamydiae bacterium]|nr:hypothetical protein [Chlamydiota bacterium]